MRYFLLLTMLSGCVLRLAADPIELSSDEIQTFNEFFLGTLEVEDVKIFQASFDSDLHSATTLYNEDVYFYASAPFEEDRSYYGELLAHELTHVWQYRYFGYSAFDNSGYEFTLKPERHLTEYGLEEQAALIQAVYHRQVRGIIYHSAYCLDCEELGSEADEILERRHQELLDAI